MAKAPVASSSKGNGRPLKPIHRTVDLLRKNEGVKRKAAAAAAAAATSSGSSKSSRGNSPAPGKGKGKEREILGDVMSLVDEVKRLPGMIQVEKFAETRAMEIHAFQTAIKVAAAQGSTRAFQSLPRHLRRRAASHNPRRVPKRLRARAAAEIDAGDNIAKKHRKIARLRSKGTLRDHLSRTAQFALRQKDKKWLSTHIWHSKRYHMKNLWGYRLPLTPTLKSFRPAYRAGRRKVIGFDTSYHGIIELEGKRDEILALLSRISTGSFAGTKYEDGSRVANITLYHFDTFPTGLIGPAEIIWQTTDAESKSSAVRPKRLWIRIHPSIYKEVWDDLKNAVSQIRQGSADQSTSSATFSTLQIQDLRGEINSLDLVGPRAGKTLRRVLRICRSDQPVKRQFFQRLRELEDPAQLPEGMIVGMNIHDPRLNFPPPKLAPSEPSETVEEIVRSDHQEPSSELARSGLWDSDVREDLTKAAYTKYQLDARRHRIGLPGTKLRPLPSDDRLPIVIYQRGTYNPSQPAEGFYGFTILLPSGPWAQYLLSSLVYSNVLVGGLREQRAQHREAGIPSFPEHYGQVCKAGREWEKMVGDREKETWDRKPPGKRPEYPAMGIKSPFVPDWAEIMSPAQMTLEETAINDTQPASPLLTPSIRPPGSAATIASTPWLVPPFIATHILHNCTPSRLTRIFSTYRSQRGIPPLSLDNANAEKMYNAALVNVEIILLGRGSPGDMARIYSLPSAGERETWIEAYETGDEGSESVGSGDVSELHKLGESSPLPQDLIGYTSTGNFSLSRGRGYALACITLKGWLAAKEAAAVLDASPAHANDDEDAKGGVQVKVKATWAGRCLIRIKNKDGHIARLAEIKLV
ncbi:hypothetical protein I317_07538 [Kwoniella heveanensis CBS 569]|nr:hypothetical protein I317_07538 [Kwoniella heveanensis CBS 569]